MPKSPPKHLERRPLPRGVARLRLAGAAGLSVAAVVVAVVGFGPGGSGASRNAETFPQTTLIAAVPTTATEAPATTTTTTTTVTAPGPAAAPEGALADRGFEAGLGDWRPLGGAELVRTRAAHTGRWAARISGGQAAAGDEPGLAVADVTRCLPGVTYGGELWVRGTRPGMEVEVRLLEVTGGVRATADTVGVVLQDSRWRRIQITHTAQRAGARLRMEVVATRLRGGDRLLVDDIGITSGGER